MIRAVTPEDSAAICAIYNLHVVGTTVTFEEEEVAVEAMRTRMGEVTASLPWLVSEIDGAIAGYAYATKWRVRTAYRYSVETTVYVASGSQGQGVGTSLYEELVEDLKRRGIHRAMAGIALPNPASVALHERLGFRKVAHFDEVGRKFDRWIDVGYWQLNFEWAPEHAASSPRDRA